MKDINFFMYKNSGKKRDLSSSVATIKLKIIYDFLNKTPMRW